MISIIIPAHNEEKRIGKTLEAYGKFFEKKKQNKEIRNFEIIVVINASSDKTLEIVKKHSNKLKELRYLNFEKVGKGFAIVEGFKDALKRDNDLIGFVDADLATSPTAFYELIKKIEEKKCDGVIASRWLKDSIIKTKQHLLRKITSRGFNFLIRSILFLTYKDTQCGAKIFKKKAIKNIINELGITKWAFDIDLLYKLKNKGFQIKEIPTIWEDKKGSKIDLVRNPIQMFSSIIRLRLLNSPLKFIVRAYDKLPENIKIHSW
jgi:glycosyltransferase involved in cell wall biosynthesis